MSRNGLDLHTLPESIGRLCAERAPETRDHAQLLESCTRLVASAFGCARSGVWEFVEVSADRRLRCLAMYDAPTDRMVGVPDSENVGAYFIALEQTGHVNACDTAQHFATAGAFASRLEARRIRSLLAAALVFDGSVRGAVTCTEVDHQVEWSKRQLGALKRVAAVLAPALFAHR